MERQLKTTILTLVLATIIAVGWSTSGYAEGDILPPDDGGVIIVPDPGEEPPPEPTPEYELWVTMPGTDIVDGKPNPPHKPVAYKYVTIVFEMDEDTILTAVVSMERKAGNDKFTAIDITAQIQDLLDNEISHILLVVCYDSKAYKGEPIVDITYEGDSPAELFRIKGTITPTVLNLGAERDYIMVKLNVEGSHTAMDINIETVRITMIDDLDITPVYGELTNPLPTQNKNFLIMSFTLATLQDEIPAGNAVMFRVEGAFDNGELFMCTIAVRVIEPAEQKVIDNQGGKIEAATAEIDVPPASLEQGVTISVDPGINDIVHILNSTPEGMAEYASRRNAAENQLLTMVGSGVSFGPEGLRFNKPVRIALDYPGNANPEKLRIFYWNKETGQWEEVPGTASVPGEKKVEVMISHFSIYQVMEIPDYWLEETDTSLNADTPFAQGEIYCYPNPAKGGLCPTIHIETGVADKVTIHIYDIAGMLIDKVEITGYPQIINDRYAYEYRWDIGDVASGVYLCSIRAIKKGFSDVKVVRKIAVLK